MATGGAGELSLLLSDYDVVADGRGVRGTDSMWTERISAASITKRFAELKGLEHADGVMLFDAHDEGDEVAEQVLQEFGKQAAAGIFAMQSVLDLERYAIGGGISARPETTQRISDEVDELFDSCADFLPFGKPQVVTCAFGNEANLIGALAFHLA